MATEQEIGLKYLFSTLSGDSQLSALAPGGIRRALAPPGTATPYVIMQFQTGTDAIAFQGVRPYSDVYFEVKAAGPANNTQPTADAASRIEALVPSLQKAITGGTLLGCYRTQPLEEDQIIDGETWTNFGGIYKLMLKAS